MAHGTLRIGAIVASLLAPSASAQTVLIIESQSQHVTSDMDLEWQTAVTTIGGTATIVGQTALDSTAFFAGTDILIVASGIIVLPANRVQTIEAFLAQGGSVYLQGEWQTSFTANQAFATIVGNQGGNFTWGATANGDLIPMSVSGPLSTTPNVVSQLGHFWYGAHGAGDATVTPFLHHGGKEFGWTFTSASGGRLVHVTDQDWISATTSPKLLENILVELGASWNPCAPIYGSGCPGTGGFVPQVSVSGCPTAAAVIAVEVENGLGGSMALLLLGTQQAALPIGAGCTLNVAPLFPFTVGPLPLGGSGGGQGVFVLPAVIPAGVPSGAITIQAIVGDPVSPLGFSMSNGVQLIFP